MYWQDRDVLNFFKMDFVGVEPWGFPALPLITTPVSHVLGLNYAKTSTDKDATVHCFVDDYQIERLWSLPSKYIAMLSRYAGVFAPDYSCWTDMPRAMQVWNVYRSRWLTAWWLQHGLCVIPTVTWALSDTFDFVFLGVTPGSVVGISTVGCFSADALFLAGMAEMVRQLTPGTIYVIGKELPGMGEIAKCIYFPSFAQRRWRHGR